MEASLEIKIRVRTSVQIHRNKQGRITGTGYLWWEKSTWDLFIHPVCRGFSYIWVLLTEASAFTSPRVLLTDTHLFYVTSHCLPKQYLSLLHTLPLHLTLFNCFSFFFKMFQKMEIVPWYHYSQVILEI